MCTIDRPRGKPFCASGCPVPEGNTTCGETRTLDIINEFKRLYEKKMEEIDKSNCGDCLQEKLKLQFDWINDLTEQNEMLVKAVEELEMEATERVKMLEDKLQKSAECICEIMKKYRENDITVSLFEEPRQRVFNLENDSKNLLEFIRRIRDEQQWSTGGLTFYEITEKDIFGGKCEQEFLNEMNQCSNSDVSKGRQKLIQQNSHIHHLEKKTCEVECLTKELKTKKEECESLQKNMVDMRQALTEEVATKHDVILKLKRECQELEERCIQADKQTAFRDDIIKGLRKEIKQLKQQVSFPEKPYPKDSDILRKEIKGERVLVINHTSKVVKNGNTTVIYLRHDSETGKERKNVFNDNDDDTKREFVHSEHITNCSKCRLKLLENKVDNVSEASNQKPSAVNEKEKTVEDVKFNNETDTFPVCKSENNLAYLNSIKQRSNLTMASVALTRRHTFDVTSNEEAPKTKFISVPEHVPVKMLISNLEVNKTQKN